MLPLSRFTQLADYVNNPDNQSILGQFRLYAILLHDPEDNAYVEMLNRKFDHFSALTGSNMLFFAFCHPSGIECRMQSSADMVRSQFMRGSAEYLASEMDYFCRLLRLDSRLPKLVVTDNLQGHSFYTLDCRTDLEHCLRLLTSVADADPAATPAMMRCLGVPADHHQLRTSLADLLSVAFAPSEAMDNSGSSDKESAGKVVAHHLSQLQSYIEFARLKCADRDDSEAEIEEYSNELSDYKALLRSAYRAAGMHIVDDPTATMPSACPCEEAKQSPFPLWTVNNDLFGRSHSSDMPKMSAVQFGDYRLCSSDYPLLRQLSPSCRSVLRTYNMYWTQACAPLDISDDFGIGDDSIRFDEQVCRLYRILSEIISCALVQRMRWALNIEMPFYYLKWKPDAVAYVVTEQKNVKLNMRNDLGQYQAPTLGECRSAFEVIASYSPADHNRLRANLSHALANTPAADDRFRSALDQITRCRNRIEHGVYCPTENEFAACFSHFKFILDTYLPQLMDLQRENSGSAG